jgi:lipopolysaccharide biosynthesis glycosyltransferase
MRSILKNGGEAYYTAYILHSDLEQQTMDDMQSDLGNQVHCQFITVDPAMFAGFPESKRYPKQIYYRLAAPLLLPDNLDRVLYLDVDTVVINSLRDLYKTDFEGAYYIACTHTREILTTINQARLGAPKDAPYVNTGVLVMNLPALRENLNLQEIQKYARENMRTFILPDQDILTALYGDKIKLVDTMRYNLSDRMYVFNNVSPRSNTVDMDWVRKNSAIIHYCGKNKPWKNNYVGPLGVFFNELNQEGQIQA